ncbi:exported hypothetical protein [Methylocella tundrae]|uniref:PepSY domain-containing protein n=1 Tax=Methylocella tundrae TaxID=227605 RepID=A0A8B6M2R1_METTU|nr:hypothetical protein [Methylocella tundrae]VTZ28119.1 exported hypothetical protein [Methylocella tundrae]VTZ49035.1 exported hypothetical protein [Methylocella tundrae]
MLNKMRALFLLYMLSTTPGFAQTSTSNAIPSPDPAPPTDSPAASSDALSDGPRKGDRWTFELKDDVTGDITSINTYTVVDVTDKEIVTMARQSRLQLK